MNRQTQKQFIINRLKNGRSITKLDGFVFGCTKIDTRISELRRDGYPILGRWETKRGKRYMRYSLGRAAI